MKWRRWVWLLVPAMIVGSGLWWFFAERVPTITFLECRELKGERRAVFVWNNWSRDRYWHSIDPDGSATATYRLFSPSGAETKGPQMVNVPGQAEVRAWGKTEFWVPVETAKDGQGLVPFKIGVRLDAPPSALWFKLPGFVQQFIPPPAGDAAIWRKPTVWSEVVRP